MRAQIKGYNTLCMIQRIQTVFLFLAIVCLGLFLHFPLIITEGVNGSEMHGIDVTHRYNGYIYYINLIFVATAAGLTLLNIFLFKMRKLQLVLCWLSIMFIGCAFGFVYYRYSTKIYPGDVVLTYYNLLALGAAIFELLAYVYIKKDENLIKSLDRLR